jgi:hypothetical protein
VVENQGDQQAIEIQPVDPQVVYVPVYNPDYFWGDGGYYPWPGLYYPGVGYGWGWGRGIHVGLYFGGCCGWGGWGWGLGWFNSSLYVNNFFFHRYGFREFGGGAGFRGNSVWVHDASHRLGVPYGNRAVAQRFGGGNVRGYERGTSQQRAGNVERGLQRGEQARGNEFRGNEARGNEARGAAAPNNHSAFGGVRSGGQARVQSDHGFSSMGQARTAPAFHGGGGGFGGGHAGGGGGHGGGRR